MGNGTSLSYVSKSSLFNLQRKRKMDSISGMEYMIDARGSVHDVRSWEIENMKQLGWRIIKNPKKRYYSELDGQNDGSDIPGEDDMDDVFLKGEWL